MSSNAIELSSDEEPKQARLIIFGEVLHDLFPDGRSILGGAPFNVAWALKGFDLDPVLLSSIGDDSRGSEILSRSMNHGLYIGGIKQLPDEASGSVRVTIENDEPSYEIPAPQVWDRISSDGWVATQFIYHGSLALRSKNNQSSLTDLLRRSNARRFFDINLRAPYDNLEELKVWLRDVDWLKLNIDELEKVSGAKDLLFEDAGVAVEQVRKTYNVKNILLTAGASGAAIYTQDTVCRVTPADKPDNFVDAVGAGDSFTAALITSILHGRDLNEGLRCASAFAAKVCGIQGATTDDKEFYRL